MSAPVAKRLLVPYLQTPIVATIAGVVANVLFTFGHIVDRPVRAPGAGNDTSHERQEAAF